jgi:hypothetical protein
MPRATTPPVPAADRVAKRRAKLRAQGLRPIQIWVPDIHAPGFADEARRQCALLNEAANTPEGRAEAEWWERVSDDAWDDLG